jgi:two-component system response regulator NreC
MQTFKKPLTKTEKLILQYISTGLTSQQIAGRLFVAKSTIDTHRKNMLRKLGVNNSIQMVMMAEKYQ